MKINENVIMNMVASHAVNNTLTWDAFDTLFAMLSRDEQYRVTDFLADQGISLVDANDDMARAYVTEFTVDGSVFGGNDPLAFAGAVKKGAPRMVELLAKAAHEGNADALDQLFRENQNLIWDQVRRYVGMCGTSLTEEDLFQAGACGMMKAVEHFDYSLGWKFSTYAVWWIRQAIFREIEDNGSTIRIPVHKQEKIRRVARLENQLIARGVPAMNRVQAIVDLLKDTANPMNEDQVMECIQLREMMRLPSLDMPVGEDGDSVLGDFIPADEKDNPENMLDRICLRSDLMNVLHTLTAREEEIISRRFGLDGMGTETLEEIAKDYGVTRERIRQIEAKALRKLHHPSRNKKLKDWMEAA